MLSKEVRDAGFRLVNPSSTTRFYHPIHGYINTKKLTVEDATRLVANGYQGLTQAKPKAIKTAEADKVG